MGRNWKFIGSELFGNYQNKHGQNDVDSIIKDLERASVVTKFDRGVKEEKVDNTKSQLSSLQSVSSLRSNRSRAEVKQVSEGAINMASKLKVDPKDLEDLPDNNYMEIQV